MHGAARVEAAMSLWDEQYKAGQGRYFPAEELVRFLGRTYGPVVDLRGSGLTAVEIGCGVGGNIRALAEWGFVTYGLECSREATRLAETYALQQQFVNMVTYKEYTAPGTIELPAGSVNLVLDVQTIQHLNEDDHSAMYQEIHRVLCYDGIFFSIHWVGSASDLPFIFPLHPELAQWDNSGDVRFLIECEGLSVRYHEFVTKSYLDKLGRWAVLEAVKA